jgi:hypothetical protein
LGMVLPAHGSRDQFGKTQKRHPGRVLLPAHGSWDQYGMV